MDRFARFVATHARIVWAVEFLIVLGAALVSGLLARDYWQHDRLAKLDSVTAQRGSSVMSVTINGSLMGAIAQLGLTEKAAKNDGQRGHPFNHRQIDTVLEATARSFGAEGVFIVGGDGVVGSSWNSDGKPSTGLNVKFRPYFQMAMQGKDSVYAAVSLARGDRALYFAVPVHAATSRSSSRVGAIVARTLPSLVDRILQEYSDIAFLLSPQGVVFASNRPEWIGFLAEEPTLERIAQVRESRQFGKMFENRIPPTLPMQTAPGFSKYDGRDFAVAEARVQWNDPYGDWKLVLMEDLSRTVSQEKIIAVAAVWAFMAFFGLMILRHLLQNRYQRMQARQQLEIFAAQQKMQAARKTVLTSLSLELQYAASLEAQGQVFLREAHRNLGALQGVVYVLSDAGGSEMALAADFACTDRPQEILAVGEGLLGQCAAEGKLRVLKTDEQTFWKIHSGLGELMPQTSIMLPLQRNNVLLGVAELAFPHSVSEAQLESACEMANILASNLEILCQRIKVEKQLAESSLTARELERMQDIERFNRLALDRERRIIQLKHEVNQLAEELGRPVPYQTTQIETEGDHRIESPLPEVVPTVGEKARLELGQLIDLAELQTLFSSFCDSVGIAAAIIDPDGKVLVASRWQRVCTDFHRVHAVSCARCIESDTELANKLKDGENFTMYRCKNGMTDCASPIFVEGQHLANVFIGQFHLSPPDLASFSAQARECGFDEADYLRAVSEAPVVDEARLPMILGFLTGFARLLSTMSLARQRADEAQRELSRQAEILKQERLAALSLAEDVERARMLQEPTA